MTSSEQLTTLEGLRKTQLKIGNIPATSKSYVKSDTFIFYSTFLQDCSHAGVAGLLIYLLKEQVNQALCVSNTLKLLLRFGFCLFCVKGFLKGIFWFVFSLQQRSPGSKEVVLCRYFSWLSDFPQKLGQKRTWYKKLIGNRSISFRRYIRYQIVWSFLRGSSFHPSYCFIRDLWWWP